MVTFSLNKIDDVSPFAISLFFHRAHFDLIQHKFMPPNKIAVHNFETDKCMRTHTDSFTQYIECFS